jgi:DNA-binding NarL/FixJ family response regulator
MEGVKINVALIDDHQLFSEALSGLLLSHEFINEVSIYRSARQFLQLEVSEMPDMIITEIILLEMSGIDFLAKLRSLNPAIKIIVLSSITEIKIIRFAIRSGVSGYLSKEASAEELKTAILDVCQGDPYIGESLRRKLISHTLVEDRYLYNLSPREREVLQYVCSGRTIKETAAEMKLSINTVRTYYKIILRKFDFNRTADLIVFAMQNGLYDPQYKKVS